MVFKTALFFFSPDRSGLEGSLRPYLVNGVESKHVKFSDGEYSLYGKVTFFIIIFFGFLENYLARRERCCSDCHSIFVWVCVCMGNCLFVREYSDPPAKSPIFVFGRECGKKCWCLCVLVSVLL